MNMYEFIFKTKSKPQMDRTVFIQTDGNPVALFLQNTKDVDVSTCEFRRIFECTEG